MDFTGKTAWITGASSGIGAALAQALAAKGAAIILSGRRADALQAVADGIATPTLVLPFETTDYDALPGLAAQAIGWRGSVDILVNNAGISQRSLATDTAPAVYHQIIGIDLLAPILLTQAVLPHLVERQGSYVVNISSVAGIAGVPLRTAYCAAKHGLRGYGDALRAETERVYGLNVVNVFPGSVRTNVSRNALNPDGSVRGISDKAIDEGLPPEECAAQIVAGMLAGQREIVVAQGMELGLATMRGPEPEKVFDLTAIFGERLVLGGNPTG